ncbi:serine/threonine protein kinase [Fictibacillus aquaticus]|uniref:Protein kinase n=1 Tax=Fictibacillus aquaticus TaxID=2021314 RepID=A0A235FE86_9BACL|nr:protein kinase [Fictibacillus aquaticus]OYD59509.1 protein kinase [Fictibacillus aquaticus]
MATIKEKLLRFLYDRPLKSGSRVGANYEIWHVLGMGSYGITYTAEDKMTGKLCAIKQLRPTKAKTVSGIRSFQREAELMRAVSGSGFPELYDVIEQDGSYFLVMEYVDGRTFEDLIFEDGRIFSEVDTMDVLDELCTLVSVLHTQGIYHRDLRIPNILDVGGRLKIIDFGLACYQDDDPEDEDPRYPEKQVMRAVSPSSDFYHMGHFALFLLYSGFEPSQKKERTWEEELSVSQEFKKVLRKMLQIDSPYTEVHQVINDLRELKIMVKKR